MPMSLPPGTVSASMPRDVRLPRGHLDYCQQVRVAGWAVDERGHPAEVTVWVDESGPIMRERCSLPRPDVAQAIGLTENCGFNFMLPRAVGLTDVVSVKVNGVDLEGSPSPQHSMRV